MNKNELKKLLEENKLAETLMKDENFKKQAEEIIKSEGVDYNPADLKSILKAVEKILSGEVKVESEEDLDEVVGGASAKGFARGAIKTVCTLGGFTSGAVALGLVAAVPGAAVALPLHAANKISVFTANNIELGSVGVGAVAGAVGGATAGYKLGNFICKKL